MKYNGLVVPETIPVAYIISAFENDMDWNKVEEYAEVMRQYWMQHEFPAIMGFPSILTEDDIGTRFISETLFEVTQEHVGKMAWMVTTDGHHRSFAAAAAGLPYLEVVLDYSCVTSEKDLKQFNK